jgi:uncharacterized protein (DUF302 family)
MNVDEDIVSRKFQIVDFDDLVDDLVAEIQQHNFHISRINHIDNIYDRLEAGIDVRVNFKHYKIVEMCNLNSCSELISADLRAGVFMPVRFAVYQRQKETFAHVTFLKPSAFARLFDSKPLMQVATQLEEEMIDVLEELVF